MKLGRTEIASLSLGALALASVVAVVATRNEPTTQELKERDKNLLPVFRKETVTELSIRHGDTKLVFLRSNEGGETGFRADAVGAVDAAAVERILDTLAFATPLRRLDNADAGSLGVDAPRATLELASPDASYRLALGKPAPAPTGAAYVAVSGSATEPFVAVVPDDVVAVFLTTAGDVRDPTLVRLGERDIAELTLERPDSSLRLVRGKNDTFRIDGGERASRDALEPLWHALSELRATRFVELGEAERARGTEARTVVHLVPREAATPRLTVEVGGTCPSAKDDTVVIVREKAVRAACVATRGLAPFSLDRAAVVDDMPFSAKIDEVETLTLARGDRKLVLTRRGTSFLLREPASAEVDLDAGNQRLSAVAKARGEVVTKPDLGRLGLATPGDRATLTVVGKDDRAHDEVVTIGRTEADGSLPVRRADDGVVLRLTREAARAFAVDSTLLRSRRLLDFSLSALVELELSQPEHQLLRRAPNGFELVAPPGFGADGELATNAVLGLGSLTALGFVADADDGSFGLATPRLTAHVRFDPGDAGSGERTLVVGATAPGGYYASFSGQPGVFLVERAVVERLETLLVDRSALMADENSLARVVLTHAGKRLVFERRGDELLPAPGTNLEPSVATEALEALGALRAEAALHTGKALPSEGFVEPALDARVEPVAAGGKVRHFRVGAPEVFRGLSVRYARADDIDATFVVLESKLRPLLDLF